MGDEGDDQHRDGEAEGDDVDDRRGHSQPVQPMGGEVRQYRVAPHPPALRALGVTYEDMDRALAQFGTNAGGGFTDLHAREYLIRNIGRTTSLDDLRNIVVAKVEGKPVYLRQVASVDYAPKVRRGDSGYMARPAVVVSIEKQPNVDTIALTRQLEDAIAGLNAHLPHGIKADQIIFRQANFIETSIRNVQRVIVEAAIVVAVVLFAFLLNWRTTAISLTAIPVSILATAAVFYFAGLTINTMTLGGIAIAIGALVDDAVVDVENIFRRLRENRAAGNPRPTFDVVVAASQEVRSGILYASVIIVLVFVPLFALTGIEGGCSRRSAKPTSSPSWRTSSSRSRSHRSWLTTCCRGSNASTRLKAPWCAASSASTAGPSNALWIRAGPSSC